MLAVRHLMNSPNDRKTFLAAIPILALFFVIAAPPAQAMDMLPHRASYDITLRVLQGHDADITGTGLVEWTNEDHCETWMFHELSALQVESAQATVELFSEMLTFEAKDGSWFRFRDESRDSDGPTFSSGEAVAGISGAPGRIVIEEPEPLTTGLPDNAVFPMGYLIDVLERAQDGERFMSHVVFDGSDGATIDEYTTFVAASEESGGHTVWPVQVSVFNENESGGPDLEISARVRDDGVVDLISYNDGEAEIVLTLVELEELPPDPC